MLPISFTDALVAIHTVDWRAAGLDLLGVPEPGTGFARREIAKWRALIDATGVEPDPILTDLICWLEANVPATDQLVLVHGAYRTGNLLIDDDRVSAVLDWETEVIGDPMYDVAYVLSELNREGTDLLSNIVERDDVPPALRGRHGHRDRRGAVATTTSCCTRCARRRSG